MPVAPATAAGFARTSFSNWRSRLRRHLRGQGQLVTRVSNLPSTWNAGNVLDRPAHHRIADDHAAVAGGHLLHAQVDQAVEDRALVLRAFECACIECLALLRTLRWRACSKRVRNSSVSILSCCPEHRHRPPRGCRRPPAPAARDLRDRVVGALDRGTARCRQRRRERSAGPGSPWRSSPRSCREVSAACSAGRFESVAAQCRAVPTGPWHRIRATRPTPVRPIGSRVTVARQVGIPDATHRCDRGEPRKTKRPQVCGAFGVSFNWRSGRDSNPRPPA